MDGTSYLRDVCTTLVCSTMGAYANRSGVRLGIMNGMQLYVNDCK
jgi:hypothetical protein